VSADEFPATWAIITIVITIVANGATWNTDRFEDPGDRKGARDARIRRKNLLILASLAPLRSQNRCSFQAVSIRLLF
jgi:hypothetical protein